MDRKVFFEDIAATIVDTKDTDYIFYPKDYVPGIDDASLTYGTGDSKKGVLLDTCVLFVDIRDSVRMNKEHQAETMGKIYSTFTTCVLKAAQFEGGKVRNIIGDRVMIVFPTDNCCTRAVDCAITINQIAGIIDKKFPNVNFRCGIGIDKGTMKVIKVGKFMKGEENDDNKGLVWVGKPANLASRLTDTANKEVTTETIHVEGTRLSFERTPTGNPYTFSFTQEIPISRDYTPDDFQKAVRVDSRGQLVIDSFHKVVSIKRLSTQYKFQPILISEGVYDEFAKANPDRNSVAQNYWKLQSEKIRNVDFPVYGANLTWSL